MSHKTKRRQKEPSIETKNLPPVEDAVREYRVIEDGAYAYHLQEKEIENHYAQNVNLRRMVQEDIRTAKELQDEEDRRARIMTLDEEEKVQQMDDRLAEVIQEEIFIKSVQEQQERKEREERDKELALLLEETERRRVESAKTHEERDHHLAKQLQTMNIDHSANGDEQRMKLMTDEGLAKRLQEEERLKAERDKRREQEVKSVIEMQDEELAKRIHDKDVAVAEAKFRKGKEKRNKSKTKGKWQDEPLYYDDNINSPTYHKTPLTNDDPNNGYQHQETRPKSHQEDYSQRSIPTMHDAPPEYRRHEDPGQRRLERPAPPQFDESHNTDVKVPLDDSQRQANNRCLNQSALEYSRDFERSSSHWKTHADQDSIEKNGRAMAAERHRAVSEAQRPSLEHERRQGSSQSHSRDERSRTVRNDGMHEAYRSGRIPPQDAPRRQENGRPMSKKEASRLKAGSSFNQSNSSQEFDGGARMDGDLQNSKNVAKSAGEEVYKKGKNKGHSQKKKGGDCKQQ